MKRIDILYVVGCIYFIIIIIVNIIVNIIVFVITRYLNDM